MASIMVLLLICYESLVVRGLDLSWTQYSDSAELPMSAKWREDMRAKLLSINSDSLSPKEKMKRKQLLRRLGPAGSVGLSEAKSVLPDFVVAFAIFVILAFGFGIWYFMFRSTQLDNTTNARARMVAARQKLASDVSKQEESAPPSARIAGAALAAALGAILDDLGLDSLEELGEEVVPAGKHQGDSFLTVLGDAAFCRFICKEPRKGWMGTLKTYIEAIEEQRQHAESHDQTGTTQAASDACNESLATDSRQVGVAIARKTRQKKGLHCEAT